MGTAVQNVKLDFGTTGSDIDRVAYFGIWSDDRGKTGQKLIAVKALSTPMAYSSGDDVDFDIGTIQLSLDPTDFTPRAAAAAIEEALRRFGQLWVALHSDYPERTGRYEVTFVPRVPLPHVNDNGFSFASIDWVLGPPTGLTAAAGGTDSIDLDWDLPNELGGRTLTAIKIQRSLDGMTYTDLTTTASVVETYEDTGLTTGTRYYYRVAAVAGTFTGPYSLPADDTTA